MNNIPVKNTLGDRNRNRNLSVGTVALGLALAVLLVPLAPSTGRAASPPASPPLVVATVGMIGDVAQELAGACAAVETLLGPGSDPHLYRPSAGDVRKLGSAGLVLYGGLHLEAGLSEVLARFAERRPTAAVAELAVPENERIAAGGALAAAGRAAGAANAAGVVYDPHVWMDVAQWSAAAGVVGARLAALLADDGACVATIEARTSAYRLSLAALDGWALQAIGSIPELQRILITAHDAFAYFGRAYGIEVEGIQGVSTETEAAVADIRRVAGIVIERGVPAIFVESTINPRTIRAVLEAVEQRGGDVEIGAPLYADALGSQGTPDGTYIGMMVHNVSVISTALGGTVPALPPELAQWEARW